MCGVVLSAPTDRRLLLAVPVALLAPSVVRVSTLLVAAALLSACSRPTDDDDSACDRQRESLDSTGYREDQAIGLQIWSNSSVLSIEGANISPESTPWRLRLNDFTDDSIEIDLEVRCDRSDFEARTFSTEFDIPPRCSFFEAEFNVAP